MILKKGTEFASGRSGSGSGNIELSKEHIKEDDNLKTT
jgi:hypothetical protein